MKYLKIILFVLPIVFFTIAISLVGAESIVDSVGVSNGYLFMFFIAFLGGISIFSGIPYPLILITFALGGLDPLYLGIATCSGVMLGDSTSYIAAGKINVLITGKLKEVFDTLLTFYDTKPEILTPLFFIYGAISPFPNDMITLSAGMKNYGFFRTMLPLSLGNLVFCLVLGYFANFFSLFF